MKVKILLLMMLPIYLAAQTQLPNGNWVHPNTISSPSFHLHYDGYYSGAYHYSAENKQSCDVLFSFRIGNDYDTAKIRSGKTGHFSRTTPFNMDTIWAKALTNCSATYDTCYWGVTIVSLAVKPFTIDVKDVDAQHVKVTIYVQDVSGTAYVKTKLLKSKDWIVFKLPNIEPYTNYFTIINKPQ